MTPDLKARLIEVCQMIPVDMEEDTNRREGQPFDGQHVAVALGEIAGTIAGLARVVEALVHEVEPS